MAKDPVCGMDVDEQDAKAKNLTSEQEGTTYYFCGAGCKTQFDRNPQRFTTPSGGEQHQH